MSTIKIDQTQPTEQGVVGAKRESVSASPPLPPVKIPPTGA